MSIWAIVPTRPFESGKARLASVLSDAERTRLNRRFFQNTLHTVLEVLPAHRVLVVSKSAEARAMGSTLGTHTIEEIQDGLNCALSVAAERARANGATGVLSISCDLPYLAASDVVALLEGIEAPCVTIAVDRHEVGTNALLMSPTCLIAYCYGPDSAARHRDRAEAAHARASMLRRPGLAFDVDTPDDLRNLRESRKDMSWLVAP
jgi:2-phospho-L-lactate guanylyltransferase